MRGTAQSLPFGTNRVRKDFTDIDPDHCALPEAMANDVTHQQLEKHTVIRGAVENPGNPGERQARAPSPGPAAPAISNGFRPPRSMITMPTMVASRLAMPTTTDCMSPETFVNPAIVKIGFK